MKTSDTPDFILDVLFFRNDNGTEPVRDWLKSLRREDKKIIGEDIKTVQYGWPIGMPVVRKLEFGIWEVRSRIKDGIVRVLFTIHGDSMVLLHAFTKKSQKTPVDDLNLAKKRMKELQ